MEYATSLGPTASTIEAHRWQSLSMFRIVRRCKAAIWCNARFEGLMVFQSEAWSLAQPEKPLCARNRTGEVNCPLTRTGTGRLMVQIGEARFVVDCKWYPA